MKTKHTEGKWEATGELDAIQVWTTNTDDQGLERDRLIAHVKTESHNPPRYDEAKANAKLISAAPDMLEALDQLKEAVGQINPSAWDKVDEEIKKSIKQALGQAGLAINKATDQS